MSLLEAAATVWFLRTICYCLHLQRGLQMHLIGFQLRATNREWKWALKGWGITSLLKPNHCTLQLSGNALLQVKLKYLEVVFTSDGSWHKEIDKLIGKANAVLHEFYQSVVTKW